MSNTEELKKGLNDLDGRLGSVQDKVDTNIAMIEHLQRELDKLKRRVERLEAD